MEKTYKRVPHNLSLSTKIINGLIEGRIISDKDGIVYIELPEETPKQLTLADCKCGEVVYVRDKFEQNGFLKVKKEGEQCDGRCHLPMIAVSDINGTLLYPKDTVCWREIPEEPLNHEFKPFDKVLVRDNQTQEWICTLLSSVKDDGDYPIYLSICNYPWLECIPYEGNEHLVGTTNNPKKE